jgi:hypothetical protein
MLKDNTRPKHRRTGHFVTRNLFDGLEGFPDLEARIAALPTQQDRGDAFEVFAEAYLATQKLVGAEEVWPAIKYQSLCCRLACPSRILVRTASTRPGPANAMPISRSSARA